MDIFAMLTKQISQRNATNARIEIKGNQGVIKLFEHLWL